MQLFLGSVVRMLEASLGRVVLAQRVSPVVRKAGFGAISLRALLDLLDELVAPDVVGENAPGPARTPGPWCWGLPARSRAGESAGLVGQACHITAYAVRDHVVPDGDRVIDSLPRHQPTRELRAEADVRGEVPLLCEQREYSAGPARGSPAAGACRPPGRGRRHQAPGRQVPTLPRPAFTSRPTTTNS